VQLNTLVQHSEMSNEQHKRSGAALIQCQLKLKLTKRQERTLSSWLFHLTAVWNWATLRSFRRQYIFQW